MSKEEKLKKLSDLLFMYGLHGSEFQTVVLVIRELMHDEFEAGVREGARAGEILTKQWAAHQVEVFSEHPDDTFMRIAKIINPPRGTLQ